MTHSEHDKPNNNQLLGNTMQKECVPHETEVCLMDYFIVLWKRRWFVFSMTLLPTLAIFTALYFWPRDYTTTYVYDVFNKLNGWVFNETYFTMLQDRFNSEDNLNKLTLAMEKNKLGKYTHFLKQNDTQQNKLIMFSVFPPYNDLSKLSTVGLDKLNKAINEKTHLLNITIHGLSKEDVRQLSSIIRSNIENDLFLYFIQEQVLTSQIENNNELITIDNNKFKLELDLKYNKELLTGLKNVNTETLNKQDGILLQLNVGEQKQYLPLNYQIQAAESKRIELENLIHSNEEIYNYHKDLLELDNKIFVKIDKMLSSDNSIVELKVFLSSLVNDYKKETLKDYLNSYIRCVENLIDASNPITKNPKISPASRGIAKKSGIAMVLSFMISVFFVLMSDSYKKQLRVS